MKNDINLKMNEIVSATNFVKDFKNYGEKLEEDTDNKYFIFKNNELSMVVITPQKYQFLEYWVEEGRKLQSQKIKSVSKRILSIIEKKDKNSHYAYCKDCRVIFKNKDNNVCPSCGEETKIFDAFSNFFEDDVYNDSFANMVACYFHEDVDQVEKIDVIEENDEYIKLGVMTDH